MDGPYLMPVGSQVCKLFIFDNVKGWGGGCQILCIANFSKNTFCLADKATLNLPERNQRHIYK